MVADRPCAGKAASTVQQPCEPSSGYDPEPPAVQAVLALPRARGLAGRRARGVVFYDWSVLTTTNPSGGATETGVSVPNRVLGFFTDPAVRVRQDDLLPDGAPGRHVARWRRNGFVRPAGCSSGSSSRRRPPSDLRLCPCLAKSSSSCLPCSPISCWSWVWVTSLAAIWTAGMIGYFLRRVCHSPMVMGAVAARSILMVPESPAPTQSMRQWAVAVTV